MSESFYPFEIAFSDTNPGGTTIIKVVDKLKPQNVIGFGVCDNSDGRVITCNGENGQVLIDLLHFLQDKKDKIRWHIVAGLS